MKKLIGVFSLLLLLVFLLPVLASAETSGNCGNDLLWVLDDEGVLTITGTGAMTSHPWTASEVKKVVIEDGVTSIGDSAFNNCSSLTSVTIPDSVTSIGNYAFSGCSSLTSITIPDGVTSIGYYAFQNCNNLTSITIPDGVTSIGDYAFQNCNNLTSITIPDGVTSIGNSAFSGCSSLTSVTIPDSVISIGNSAFSGCRSLTSVTIPKSVTSIGNYAFSGCSSLTSVTIPESVTSIGDSAFSSCRSLTSVTIPESVTSIGSYAFQGCSSLTSVTIPESVTSIGNFAFQGCSSLTSVTIPESVTSIGNYAFADSYSLDKTVFLVRDEDTTIQFGNDIFRNYTPTIYCHIFTAPDAWCSQNGIKPVYLEEIDINTIRTVALPKDFRMACGDERQLDCTVFPVDGAPITWTSSDPVVLSVEDGLVTALIPGTATVTATVGTVSANVTIETYTAATGFELNASELWVLAKDDVQLTAAAYEPAGASAELTWRSSDTARATVDDHGLVTTVRPGDVTITSTSEKGVVRSCLLHLCYPVSAVELTAPQDKLITGRELQLTADVTMSSQSCVNHLVTFASSDEAVATVDAETGVMRGVAPGEATITATARNGKAASVALLVVDECDEHTPVTDEALAPTCTETGLTEGSHCAVCSEVLVAQTVVPALGHEWGNAAYAWSDDNSEVTATRICVHDEAHVEEETATATGVVTRQPTCTEKGETTYTAVFENAAFEARTKTLENVDALGHAWEDVVYTWSEDNDSVTATRICTNDAGHVETETAETTSEVTEPATCTEKGKTTYTSAAFDNEAFEAQTQTIEDVPALGHTPVTDAAVAPTCTQTGLTEGSHCEVCNAILVEQETVDRIAHTYVTDKAVEPTCMGTGLTSGFHCSACGEVFVAQEIVSALGHVEVTDAAVEPTCTETGLTEGKHCSRCNEVLVAQEAVAALGHDLVNHDAQAATCMEIGWNAYDTCSRCDYTTYEESEALGHDLVNHEAKAATCTEAGWNAYDTCSRCDYTTYEEIEALGHDLVHHEAKAATCTEAGWNAYDTCSRCDYTTYEEILEKGHTEVIDAAVESTYEKTGLTEGKHCSVCGTVLVPQEVIPILEPTATPTMKPTAVPTAKPTTEPTAVPTAKPTAVPTAKPTTEPTAVPTAKPTAKPTATPTVKPTAAPTAKPTAVPTAQPTATPTVKPTATPTAQPTAVPTVKPTAVPTAQPTATPTATPTAVPTVAPTAIPSAEEKAAAEAKAAAEKKAAEDKSAADAAIAKINALPATAGTGDKAAVEAARAAYNALTEDQKKLVSADVVNKLTGAESQVKAAEDKAAADAKAAAAKVKLSKCKITVKAKVYTGKALKPAVTVKYQGKALKKGTDYTVSYKNNKAIGKATVIVKGKGKYTGTVKKAFKINPKAVKGLKLKAGPKQITVTWKKDKTVTGYEIQYALNKSFKGAKKVTIKKAATVKTVIEKLKANKTYYVRIRGYKTVKKAKYVSAWSKVLKATTKK